MPRLLSLPVPFSLEMYAVASLLYTPEYLPGALVLGHRLRLLVAANTELVLLIDLPRFSALHQALLADVWHRLVDVNVILSRLAHQLEHDLKRPELAQTYTKIHLWALDYDKVLYLDADTLPLADSDSSVVDLLRLDFPQGKILAAPDSGFPDIFNSGVFGLTPNAADYANLVALAASDDPAVSFDGADQGLLNQYFNSNPDWVALQLAGKAPTSNWIPIPFLYNTTPTAQYEYLPAFNYFSGRPAARGTPHTVPSRMQGGAGGLLPADEIAAVADTLAAYGNAAARYFSRGIGPLVKLVHFIGPVKPWQGQQSGIFQKWWDAWFAYSRGLSIHLKLGEQLYSVSVKRLYAPGEEPPQEPKQYTPGELCDPANYQQFASSTEHSTSAWDATREAPPRERPADTTFSVDISEYESQWDRAKESIERETEEDEEEEEIVEWEDKEDKEELDKLLGRSREEAHDEHYYGFHTSQVPERVFDKRSNYNPSHSLLKALSAVPKKKAPMPDIARLKVTEEKVQTFEPPARAPAPVVPPVAHGDPGSTPKIFPWEYKNAHRAERSFD